MKRVFFLLLLLLVSMPFASHGETGQLEQGIAEYRQENFEEAIPLLTEARRLHPDSPMAAYYLGLALKQTGDSAGAIDQFRTGLGLTPVIQDIYPELVECLYQRGELVEARSWIDRAEKGGVMPATMAFLKGLVQTAAGDDPEAVSSFRKASELDRTMVQAANMQIALVQARGKNLDEARQSLKAVIAIDPTTELASLAQEYDVSFGRLIESHRPWRLTAGLAYTYDDNVVAKPSVSIQGVEISGEEDSGMVASFRAEYAPLLGNGWLFSSQYALASTTYGSTGSHNTIIQALSLLPGYEFAKGAVTVPLSYTHALLAEENYLLVGAVRPTLSLLLPSGHIGQLSAGYARRELLQAPLAPEEDRDGNVYSLSAGYLVPVANGRGLLSLRYEYTEDRTVGSNWANRGHRGSLSALVPLMTGLKVSLSGDIYKQDYLNTHSLSVDKRDDTIYTGTGGLTWDMTSCLAFTLNYTHTRSESNISIYDYRRNVVTAGFEATF